MRTSIATVSISGDLPEKLEAIAAAGFDGVEIFENDFLTFDAPARPRSGRWPPTLVSPSRCSSPSAISKACPSRSAPAPSRGPRRKFDLMQELGTDLMLVCSNVSPAALGGIERAAADFRELGEHRRQARRTGRLRGPGLGPARQRPPRRLGDRPPRRPSQHRPDPRQLPHPVAPDRPRLDPLDPRRPDLHRATGRCAADRHGPALLEPALPQHARRGRPAGRRLHACGGRYGLRRAAVARDLQRPVSRRFAQGRSRSMATGRSST